MSSFPSYVRNAEGTVAHLEGCPRATDGSRRWVWAEGRTWAQIQLFAWVMPCKICRPDQEYEAQAEAYAASEDDENRAFKNAARRRCAPSSGSLRVRTESGSRYIVDLDDGLLVRLPGPDSGGLRLDRDVIPLLSVEHLVVGQPAVFVLAVRKDGIYTRRTTTPVVEITEE